jgi:hypothetical protein
MPNVPTGVGDQEALRLVRDMMLNPLIASAYILRMDRAVDQDDEEEDVQEWLEGAGYATTPSAILGALDVFRSTDLGWWRGVYRLTVEGKPAGALAISSNLVTINNRPIKTFTYQNDTLSWLEQGTPACSASLKLRLEGGAVEQEMAGGNFRKACSGVLWAAGAPRPGVDNSEGATNSINLGPLVRNAPGRRLVSQQGASDGPFIFNGTYNLMVRATGSETWSAAPDLTINLTKSTDSTSAQVTYSGTITYGLAPLGPQQFNADPTQPLNTMVDDSTLYWTDTQNTITTGKLLFSAQSDGRNGFWGQIRSKDDTGSGPNVSGIQPKATSSLAPDSPGTIAGDVLSAATLVATIMVSVLAHKLNTYWQNRDERKAEKKAFKDSSRPILERMELRASFDNRIVANSAELKEAGNRALREAQAEQQVQQDLLLQEDIIDQRLRITNEEAHRMQVRLNELEKEAQQGHDREREMQRARELLDQKEKEQSEEEIELEDRRYERRRVEERIETDRNARRVANKGIESK